MALVNAHDMSKGIGGWKFRPVPFNKIKAQALMWWTFPPAKGKKPRPFGHVGNAREDYFRGYVLAIHASRSKKKIVESIVKRAKINDKLETNYMGKYFVVARNVQ